MDRPFVAALVAGCFVAAGAAAPAQVLKHNFLGTTGSQLGKVASAPDWNHDANRDYVAAAPYDHSLGVYGLVSVISGYDGTKLWNVYGSETYASLFGWDVDMSVDLTGDGVEELVIGEPWWWDAAQGVLAGRVNVYDGATQALLYRAYGRAAIPHSEFGWSVAPIADLDGDALPDLVVGSASSRTVELLSGADGSHIGYANSSAGSGHGYSVAALDDIDGDGVADFATGEPFNTVGGYGTSGIVRLWSGATRSQLSVLDSPVASAGANFGWSLAVIADADGDGYRDLAVGAPLDLDPSNVLTGAVHVWSAKGATFLYALDGKAQNDRFGHCVADLGDFDGRGVHEFAVGAPAADRAFVDTGAVTIHRASDGKELFEYSYVGYGTDSASFGDSIAGVDFEGDGFTDVVVGAPQENNFGTANDGEVWAIRSCPALWSNYGSGWPGTLGVPSLVSNAHPALGVTVTVGIGNSYGVATFATLLVGLDDASIVTNKGGTLLVTPLLSIPLFLPVLGASVDGDIPNDPALACTPIFAQALAIDPGASKGMAFTPGLRLMIGFDVP
ncbi:MAG: VCBS repeat-containing protein [Planctomycetes bacterium]|nr:VCBS repeat-containing protein [Planctomycetota bacterium]